MHQMIRALVPGCTVVISFFLLQKQYSKGVLVSLVVIFFGVCLYSYKVTAGASPSPLGPHGAP